MIDREIDKLILQYILLVDGEGWRRIGFHRQGCELDGVDGDGYLDEGCCAGGLQLDDLGADHCALGGDGKRDAEGEEHNCCDPDDGRRDPAGHGSSRR